ncbi:MAG TPA: hypothetical protein VEW03_12010, partial [Longimicrobiaceae bacterium]|nr:hypothetical protein [Longimicrobiaceae bacterium]
MTTRPALAACALLAAFQLPLPAQTVLDRSPLVSGGWVGLPGSLSVSTPFRFSKPERPDLDVFVVPSFQFALGLPAWTLVGGQYAAQSQVVEGDAGEWEVFGRFKPLVQYRGAPFDLAVQAGYNGGAKSLDGEAVAARWLGPLRVMGAGRFFSDAFGSGESRGAVAGGAVFYPAPRTLAVALAGDAGVLLDREEGEDVAWSVALQVGIPYTVNTVSLFATNTGSSTLQGVSRGMGRTQYGLELTLPIPLGSFVGWYVPREVATRSVHEPPGPPARLVSASIYRFAYVQDRIEIEAGTTVEWTNDDAMVHTVT